MSGVEDAGDKALISHFIRIITYSPFGQEKKTGKRISKLLSISSEKGLISYADLEGDRGDILGEEIRISMWFRGKPVPSMATLVHEGSHRMWDIDHPEREPDDEKRRIANKTDEDLAQARELILYQWLKDVWWRTEFKKEPFQADEILERRLKGVRL